MSRDAKVEEYKTLWLQTQDPEYEAKMLLEKVRVGSFICKDTDPLCPRCAGLKPYQRLELAAFVERPGAVKAVCIETPKWWETNYVPPLWPGVKTNSLTFVANVLQEWGVLASTRAMIGVAMATYPSYLNSVKNKPRSIRKAEYFTDGIKTPIQYVLNPKQLIVTSFRSIPFLYGIEQAIEGGNIAEGLLDARNYINEDVIRKAIELAVAPWILEYQDTLKVWL